MHDPPTVTVWWVVCFQRDSATVGRCISLREAVELSELTADQCICRCSHFETLGFVVERRFEKRRLFRRQSKFQGFSLTLVADEFSGNGCNGRLKTCRFISTSIETEWDKLEDAERALGDIESQLLNAGAKIIRLDGNYEDYYYGVRELPEPCS